MIFWLSRNLVGKSENISESRRKNLVSATPLRFALKSLILELNDSAMAFYLNSKCICVNFSRSHAIKFLPLTSEDLNLRNLNH